ncbi:MAG: hypothetical protein O4965_13685 [Trichodesmium sp. St19_bin1]|nr:hypothetical protein [Trichodesmium sp. St19_bin1]
MSWKCNNGHPEVTNYGNQCQICGCHQPAPIVVKNTRRWLILVSFVFLLGGGYGTYLYFKPCPSGLYKQGLKCQSQSIFINPNAP